jgi:hypothetical protein
LATVFSGVLRLILADLRSSWFQAIAALVLIGASIVGVAYFTTQAQQTQSQVRAEYQEEGASAFVIEVSAMSGEELDRFVAIARRLPDVGAVDAPYNGLELGIQADASFLVFENAKQKEYLGAHTNVLGVGPFFSPKTGYYVDFRWLNPSAPRSVLGIPLLPAAGEFRSPQAGEMLLPTTVTDYVGVQPGAQATVELVYANANPPIVRRLDNVRLIGTFDIAGPDKGRIDPFWQLSYVGESLPTARGPGGTEATTVPVILNLDVVREFLRDAESQRGSSYTTLPARSQLVVLATSVSGVPAAQREIVSLLETRGFKPAAGAGQPDARTYRVLVPERNNFINAQREQRKIGTGGAYFAGLLLGLLAFGTGGLQVLATLTRWRDYGVLQAVGFSPSQITVVYGGQLLLVLTGAIFFAGFAVFFNSRLAQAREVFATAAGLAVLVTIAGSVPALLWPMRTRPAAMLKELQ